MRTIYIAPKMIQVTLQTRHLFSTSTINAKVYTDESQDVGNALVKESSSRNIWDEEW